MPTLHEQYYGRPWKSRRNNPISSSDGGGYMSYSPPAAYRSPGVQQRSEQTHSGSFLDRSGYETGQSSPSVLRVRPGPSRGCSSDRKMSSLLQGGYPGLGRIFSRPRARRILEQCGVVKDILFWFAQGRCKVGSLAALPQATPTLFRPFWHIVPWPGTLLISDFILSPIRYSNFSLN
jgi:hypothetical protein